MKIKLIFLLSLFLLNQQYYINGMINIVDHPGVVNETFNPFADIWQHGDEIINAWKPDRLLNNKLDIQNGSWSKNISKKPEYIRALLRYVPNNINYNINESSKKCLVFAVVHGTGFGGQSGNNNPNYYDKTSDSFCGFLKFAQSYLNRYNKKRSKKNKCLKFLHLFSYKWSGDLFDARREPEGKLLGRYLNRCYLNSQIIPFGHSHGCNVLNFASKELTRFDETNNNIRQKRLSKPYKARIRFAVYFAPPSKQDIIDTEKSNMINVLGWTYDQINNHFGLKLTNYNQLFTFYSKDDWTAQLGTIDGGTASSIVTTALFTSGVTHQLIQTGNDNLLYVSAVTGSLMIYSSYNAGASIAKKCNSAHYYNDILPKNTLSQIEGPKIHIETMVDEKRIGHSNDIILKYCGDVLEYLMKEYKICISTSGHFRLNINTQQEKQLVQCVLKKFNTNDKDVDAGFQNDEIFDKKLNAYYDHETIKQIAKAKNIEDHYWFTYGFNIRKDSIEDLTNEQIKARTDENGKNIPRKKLEKIQEILFDNCVKAEGLESKGNGLLQKINDLYDNKGLYSPITAIKNLPNHLKNTLKK